MTAIAMVICIKLFALWFWSVAICIFFVYAHKKTCISLIFKQSALLWRLEK